MGSHHPLGSSAGPKQKISHFVLKNKQRVKNQNKQLFIWDQYCNLVVKAPHYCCSHRKTLPAEQKAHSQPHTIGVTCRFKKFFDTFIYSFSVASSLNFPFLLKIYCRYGIEQEPLFLSLQLLSEQLPLRAGGPPDQGLPASVSSHRLADDPDLVDAARHRFQVSHFLS